ncbi:hypothetical protein JCM12294_44910 [Desulfocicer niacini]
MMTKQTNSKKDLTKKDLIKILKKIDWERTQQNLKKDSVSYEESPLIPPLFERVSMVSGSGYHQKDPLRHQGNPESGQ